MSHSNPSRTPAPAHARLRVVLALCVSFSGCEFGRSHFQMNSNSPTPFFGIDLLPRRKTTSIATPPVGQQMASAAAVSGEIHTVDETPSRPRFWQRNSQSVETAPMTLVLPLSKPNPDQRINRGPVELLP